MSSIVLNQFRRSNAQVFYDSFVSNNYYLSLGRPNSWDDDEAPPVAFESSPQIAKIHRDIIFSLYVDQSNVAQVIPRINWTHETIYDMYNDGISSSNPSSTGATSLSDSKFYVINVDYNVYVCLDNNGGIASTIDPGSVGDTGTSPYNVIRPSDGYVWKYLYTIPTSEVQKFLSLDFMPVLEDNQVAAFAEPSSIETVLLKNGGSGYLYDESGTQVPVHGDGDGAQVEVIIDDGGTITAVSVPTGNSGTGYSFASLNLSSLKDSSETDPLEAIIDLIISPKDGFGANNAALLNSVFVMASITISDDGSDTDTDIITDQEFRQISLIKNPTSSTGLTTALSLSALKVMMVSGSDEKIFIKDETIVGSDSGAEGTVVSFDLSSGKLQYIQTNESGLGLDDNGDIKDFTSEGIKGLLSETEAGILGFTSPEQDLYSGDLLYTENRPPIYRTTDQEENIKLVIEF